MNRYLCQFLEKSIPTFSGKIFLSPSLKKLPRKNFLPFWYSVSLLLYEKSLRFEEKITRKKIEFSIPQIEIFQLANRSSRQPSQPATTSIIAEQKRRISFLKRFFNVHTSSYLPVVFVTKKLVTIKSRRFMHARKHCISIFTITMRR